MINATLLVADTEAWDIDNLAEIHDNLYVSRGVEQPLIIFLLCCLILFLFRQIYK